MVAVEFENLEVLGGLVDDFRNDLFREIKLRAPSELRQTLNGSNASGRLYARSSGASFKRFHRASAKGQPPANDTFELYRSIRAEQSGDEVTIHFAEHAQWLDTEIFGGYLNRDFIMPSLDRILT